jgi:hypothetical protein
MKDAPQHLEILDENRPIHVSSQLQKRLPSALAPFWAKERPR